MRSRWQDKQGVVHILDDMTSEARIEMDATWCLRDARDRFAGHHYPPKHIDLAPTCLRCISNSSKYDVALETTSTRGYVPTSIGRRKTFS